MNITPEHSRGQLEYYVQSKKSIPMGSEYPIEIHYKSSYISPILDFFQVYGLPFPCKNFYVELYLEDGLEKEYSPYLDFTSNQCHNSPMIIKRLKSSVLNF